MIDAAGVGLATLPGGTDQTDAGTAVGFARSRASTGSWWCSGCRCHVDTADGACSACGGPVEHRQQKRFSTYTAPPSTPRAYTVSLNKTGTRRGYYVPPHARSPVDDPNAILKVCAECGHTRPHGRRSEDPSKPRAMCKGCMKGYLKEWRSDNWQKRKLRDTWRGMIDRCHNPQRMRRWAWAAGIPKYRDYGDAGVTVCKRWRGEKGLEHFIADMGEPPTKAHTLDRIRPSKGYAPSNCRWADKATQDSNRKNTRWLEAPAACDPAYAPQALEGETFKLSLSEWQRRTGVSRHVIARRMDRGLEGAAALAPLRLEPAEAVPF